MKFWDLNTGALLDTLSGPADPVRAHITPDGLSVAIAESSGRIEFRRLSDGSVVKTITTGKGAHGVTVSDAGDHVFVTNIVDGTVSEISVATQSVVRTHKVGEGPNGITFQAQ